MANLAQYITPTLLFPLAVLVLIFLFFRHYRSVAGPRTGTLDWIAQRESRPRLTFDLPVHPMERRDLLPLLAVTAVYAVTAFWALGSFTNPQTFQTFTRDRTIAFTLEEEISFTRLEYYPGLSTGSYTLEYSSDGQAWDVLSLKQEYVDLFKWNSLTPESGPITARFFRLTASRGDLELGELAFRNGEALIPVAPEGGTALFDEQDLVPDESTYLNSTYFDEIYHARTAYEHLQGVYPYEISHPPLGKLIIGLGIRAFGMTPFGWRFMGTLFGVAMLPLAYIFLKNLFGKTAVACCGTILLASDFMHLTQTRIATIDTYGVFFILLMYYFMYRWLTQPPDGSFRPGCIWLLLSGLAFGLGAASKWTVIYGGGGLAVLFFLQLRLVYRDMGDHEERQLFRPWVVKTLALAVLAFVLIPAAIYCLSYLPYAQARGDDSLSNLLTVVLDNQTFMFTYHKGVSDAHPYSSRWWQWLLDLRPILYYRSEVTTNGLRSAFAAFNNPVLSWSGLFAVGVLALRSVRRRCGMALFLLVGYLAQLLPWLLISRTTFAYHYFPSSVFLVFALAYLFSELEARGDLTPWQLPVYGLTGLSVCVYALFYPFLTGVMVPVWYTTWILKWLPSWPL
ncbi:hypothetical protein SDC9_81210 [bioreactor metagenome]|uniref:Dolichyl-phosphate-mannose--protein mannosyltransferase n=1 Tax=bioreactor metagenome TaxID=1076179 RepID=A0A644Z9J4_9ZZZZ